MQTVPSTTHVADSARVGHRCPNQRSDISRQHTETPIARFRPTGPCGPNGLMTETAGTTPSPAMIAAMTRHVLACIPRPARTAVNQL